MSDNKEILIVSSGAIALGKSELNLQNKSLKLSEKQAAAATGQILLAKAWKSIFEKVNIKSAIIQGQESTFLVNLPSKDLVLSPNLQWTRKQAKKAFETWSFTSKDERVKNKVG